MAEEYIVEDNTYILTGPEIETEVGDIMQPLDFYPQVKIKKWDNEVNFSMRLDYTTVGSTVLFDGTTINWFSADGKRKIKFYEIDNGYEMEVYLNEKPPTKEILFTIRNKELAWHFQPELTQAEIDMGCRRPDNVVNSYAVYHNSKRDNNYKTGKAFHYYRPWIVDADGNGVWGDIVLDLENETIKIVIPEDFYNNATYPIGHVAGATFGYDAGQTTAYRATANLGMSSVCGPASAGCEEVISAHVYVENANGSPRCKMAIHQWGSSGETVSLIANAVTPAIGLGFANWYYGNFALSWSISLSGDDAHPYYFLTIINEVTNSIDYFYDTYNADNASLTGNSFSTPTGFIVNGFSWLFAVYVTYQPPRTRAIPGAGAIDFFDPGIT
jgi:hypothetical protein